MEISTSEKHYSFLTGGGEMGQLTRAYDWSLTSVGPVDQWPQSLRTTISIILNSRFPMFLFWGADHTCFYNDAYRPSLGIDGKHPYALGKTGEEVWQEIWPDIYPLINQVLSGKGATWNEDQLLPIYRNGKLEDVYWTYSYSPVCDESGQPAGVFVTCSETTKKIETLAALRESANELSFAIEATGLGVWDLNPVTNKFKANNRLKEWFGLLPEQEIDLQTAIAAIDEKDRRRVALAVENALQYQSGGNYEVEYTIVNHLTQQHRVVIAKGKAAFNEHNIAYRFNGTLQDITEYKAALKKAEDSEQEVRALVESAPFPIAVYIGKEMRIQIANQAIINVYGKGNQVVGKSYSEILPELDNQDIFNQVREVLNTGIPFHAKNQRVDIVVNDALQSFYFNYSFTPLFDSTGAVYGVMNTGSEVTDLVVAKQQLEASEANLRNMILQSPVAICILKGPEPVVEIANEMMLELLGKNGDELTGHPLFDAVPELKNEGLEVLLAHVRNTGEAYKAYGVAFNLQRGSATEKVYVDFVYEPYFEKDNSITAIIVVAIDVTEQVTARKKIENSESRFRLMADAMPQFVWTGDAEGNINYYNEAVYNYTGLSLEDLQKDGWSKMIHPDDREENISTWAKSISSGETYSFQHRFRSKTGSYRWHLSRAIPQRNNDGSIHLWIGTSTDIHEQKIFAEELEKQVLQRTRDLELAQVSLREGNQYLQNIINKFESALASLVPVFEDGKIVDFYFKMTNLAYTPYSKLAPEKIVHKRVSEVFPGYFKTDAFAKYVETYETGKNNDWELHYNVDDLDVYLQLTVCRMDQEVVVNFTDITRLKNLQLDLLNKLKELERSNDELQQFAHVASHDLKEPVRKIRTFGSRMMADFADDLPEKAKHYLDKIDNAAARIYAMIDGVLRYSSLNEAEQPLETVSLNMVMHQVQENLELMIEQKQAIIRCDQLPGVEASHLLMYQLFYNLVNNALKFARPGVPPVIDISASIKRDENTNQSFAVIRIADNGIGFKQDYADKIFKTFVRLNSKDQYEGTGLGLSLCQKIAERFGGSIQAEASDGTGAVFTVVLPLEQ